jgi:2-methylcitrate dehydratase PrpD
MTRLGRAIDGPTVLYRGIWPTYFAAPFGIAAVAARLLKLPPPTAANALAHALTYAAPGVGHSADATARWFAAGNAARNGLTAALVAQQGHGADLGLLDGQFLRGIYNLTPDISALTGGLGRRHVLPEVSFKPWCAARQTMAATQALKEIITSGVPPEALSEITAYVLPPHRKMIDHGVMAGDRISHLTSVQYAMAVAAVAPERAFVLDPSHDSSPAVAAFMAKITVVADESLLADYPRTWPARVVVAAGGERHERRVIHIPGDPARAFDRAQVHGKFLKLAGPALGARRAEQLLARCGEAVAAGKFAALMADIEQACVP